MRLRDCPALSVAVNVNWGEVVATEQLILREVGVDDGGAVGVESGVDNIIEAGGRELIVDLCAEVVKDQQIAHIC